MSNLIKVNWQTKKSFYNKILFQEYIFWNNDQDPFYLIKFIKTYILYDLNL